MNHVEEFILLTPETEVIVDEGFSPPATTIAYSVRDKPRSAEVHPTFQRSLDNCQLGIDTAAASLFIPSSQQVGGVKIAHGARTRRIRKDLNRIPNVVDRQDEDRESLKADTGISLPSRTCSRR